MVRKEEVMRILQIVTLSNLGGAQKVVTELSNGLVERGCEVFVLSDATGEIWDLLDDRITILEVSSFRREIHPVYDLLTFFRICLWIVRIRPQILHLHSSKAGALGRIAGKCLLRKIVYTVHGFDSIRKANQRLLWVEKILQYFCDRIVAVSEYDRRLLSECSITKVTRIYNGINPVPRRNKSFQVPVVVEHALKAGKKIILTIARTSVASGPTPKRPDLFARVAERFGDAEDVVFVWIGCDREVPSSNPRCHFIAPIFNAAECIRYCDIFLLLSDYEGLPMTILEAMAEGRPIVASAVGGVRELLGDGCGVPVRNNVDEVSRAIKRILGSSDYAETMAANARRKFEKFFRAEAMVKAYLHLYAEVLGRI